MADPVNVARGAITLRVGFTGTREGCTSAQGGALARFVRDTPMAEFHHGCCLGADAEAAGHVEHYSTAVIIGHPPENAAMVSETALLLNFENRQPLPYLERNCAIVDATDILIACPKGPEERRSGTWATVRYGRKCGKRIVLFFPDGSVVEEVAHD